MKIVLTVLFGISFLTSGCAGCDDAASEPNDGQTDMSIGDMAPAEDMSLDSGDDLGSDADVLDASNPDMEEDMPVGPRAALEFVGANVIEEGSSSSLAVADDGDGGWYVATASEGRDLVFEPGADQEIIDTSGLNGFRSVFAHYGQSGELLAARAFTEYAGGPLPGGTSRTRVIAVEASGQVLIAGEFGASVRFGNTVWSTPQGNVSGAISTSRETYLVRINPQTLSITPIFRLRSPSPGFSNSPSSIVAHSNGDFTIAGYFESSVTFPDGTVLTTSSVAGYLARFSSNGTLLWVNKIGAFTGIEPLDDAALVRFQYVEAFELDGVSYSAPPQGERGFGLGRIEADGSVEWVIRVEEAGVGFLRASTPGLDGKLYIQARLENARFVDLENPPVFTQSSVILAVDASTGSLDVISPEKISQSDSEQIRMITMDDSGVLWAIVTLELEENLRVEPRFQAALDLGIGETNLMLGYDSADGSLLYARRVADNGILSAPVIKWLPSSAQILLGGHFYGEMLLEPASMSPVQLSNSTPPFSDTLFVRYR